MLFMWRESSFELEFYLFIVEDAVVLFCCAVY